MIPPEILNEAVQRIVQVAQPLKVILFGSQARGTAGTNSDVDFLVIGQFNEPRPKLFVRINRALNGLGLNRDIVLMSPEAFEIGQHILGTVARPAALEGIVLYDASR